MRLSTVDRWTLLVSCMVSVASALAPAGGQFKSFASQFGRRFQPAKPAKPCTIPHTAKAVERTSSPRRRVSAVMPNSASERLKHASAMSNWSSVTFSAAYSRSLASAFWRISSFSVS